MEHSIVNSIQLEHSHGTPKGANQMNIEQYRAMKAQMQDNSTKEGELSNVQIASSTPDHQTQTNPKEGEIQTTSTGEGQQAQPNVEPSQTQTQPTLIDVNGEKVTLEELTKGYLRQSDYTRKNQDVARLAKEQEEAIRFYETLKQNPELVQQLQQVTPVPAQLDPVQAKMQELEDRYYDLMLEREIEQLSSKYTDFEVREVLQVAQQKQLTNLEDAYLLYKSTKQPDFSQPTTPVDVDAIKKQVREELLKELESERGATQSIISTSDNGQVVQTSPVNLTDAEKKVARAMKMSEEEYAKWRNVK